MTASFLVMVQIVLVVVLVIAVLLQKSSSIGLGAYSGSNDSVFGAKGPSSFLAKTTFALGFAFVVVAIWLGVVFNNAGSESLLDNSDVNAAPTMNTTKTLKDTNAPKVPAKQ